jgi:hypothetical protein
VRPTLKIIAFALAAATLAVTGCGGERDALAAKRQRWAVERRGLEETLDQLEERMLSDQARVRFWQEMKARHESVTAVACTNLERHAESMAFLGDVQRGKRDALTKKQHVARLVPAAAPDGSAHVVETTAHVASGAP